MTQLSVTFYFLFLPCKALRHSKQNFQEQPRHAWKCQDFFICPPLLILVLIHFHTQRERDRNLSHTPENMPQTLLCMYFSTCIASDRSHIGSTRWGTHLGDASKSYRTICSVGHASTFSSGPESWPFQHHPQDHISKSALLQSAG